MTFKQLLLGGAAVGLLLAIPAVASAQETTVTLTKTYDETVDVNVTNTTEVELIKKIDVRKDVDFLGTVGITGSVSVSQASMATVDNKQIINDNNVSFHEPSQDPLTNNAELNAAVLQTASGNIGLNVAAGDNNVQDNAAAIAAIGAAAAAGSADAETFSLQKALNNAFNGDPSGTADVVTNRVSVLENVLQGASGNIGVNVASGAFNGQKNSLAISSVAGNAVLAEASAAVLQQATFNNTAHNNTSNTVSLGGSVLAAATGNIGANFAVGTNNLQHNSLSITSAQ